MAINKKDNPAGIDKHIQRMQEVLYSGLKYQNKEAYGRIYKVVRDEKTIPAWYVGQKEYKEVLLNDEVDLSFFFVENQNTTKSNQMYSTSVDVIFMLNLENLKPSINHRADEEIRAEIESIINGHRKFKTSQITKGIEALNGFDHELIDMQPYHFLKFTGTLNYQINC